MDFALKRNELEFNFGEWVVNRLENNFTDRVFFNEITIRDMKFPYGFIFNNGN